MDFSCATELVRAFFSDHFVKKFDKSILRYIIFLRDVRGDKMKSFGKYLSAVLICAMSLGFLSCCSKNTTKSIDEIVQRNGMPIISISPLVHQLGGFFLL